MSSINFFDKYPYSNLHELNLDWILAEITKLDTTVKSWVELAEELKNELANIQALEGRVDAIESAISDLNDIRSDIRTLRNDLNSLADKEQADFNAIISMFNGIDEKFARVQNQISGLYTYIDNNITSLRSYINSEVYRLRYEMSLLTINLDDEIKELNDKLDYYIKHTSVDVFNPIRGKRMLFDANNKALCIDLHDAGTTYGELSQRRITYNTLRQHLLKYREVSSKGGYVLTHSRNYMYSPISGRFTSHDEAISFLAGVLCGSLTYGELRELEKTYDDLNNLTYLDIIKLSNRTSLTYGDVIDLTINGKNLLGF